MKPFLIARAALTLGACAALLITNVVLSLVPAHDRPVTAPPHSLEHLTIFFAAGLAFGIGYPQRQGSSFLRYLFSRLESNGSARSSRTTRASNRFRR